MISVCAETALRYSIPRSSSIQVRRPSIMMCSSAQTYNMLRGLPMLRPLRQAVRMDTATLIATLLIRRTVAMVPRLLRS